MDTLLVFDSLKIWSENEGLSFNEKTDRCESIWDDQINYKFVDTSVGIGSLKIQSENKALSFNELCVLSLSLPL